MYIISRWLHSIAFCSYHGMMYDMHFIISITYSTSKTNLHATLDMWVGSMNILITFSHIQTKPYEHLRELPFGGGGIKFHQPPHKIGGNPREFPSFNLHKWMGSAGCSFTGTWQTFIDCPDTMMSQPSWCWASTQAQLSAFLLLTWWYACLRRDVFSGSWPEFLFIMPDQYYFFFVVPNIEFFRYMLR